MLKVAKQILILFSVIIGFIHFGNGSPQKFYRGGSGGGRGRHVYDLMTISADDHGTNSNIIFDETDDSEPLLPVPTFSAPVHRPRTTSLPRTSVKPKVTRVTPTRARTTSTSITPITTTTSTTTTPPPRPPPTSKVISSDSSPPEVVFDGHYFIPFKKSESGGSSAHLLMKQQRRKNSFNVARASV